MSKFINTELKSSSDSEASHSDLKSSDSGSELSDSGSDLDSESGFGNLCFFLLSHQLITIIS